jgi:hypothetical protein
MLLETRKLLMDAQYDAFGRIVLSHSVFLPGDCAASSNRRASVQFHRPTLCVHKGRCR